jgi:hypothetical protein
MSVSKPLSSLGTVLLCMSIAIGALAQDEDLSLQQGQYELPPLEPSQGEIPEISPDRLPAPQAQSQASSQAPQAPEAPTKLFTGGGVAVLGSVGSSEEVALGFHGGAALFSVGLAIHYDPAGLSTPGAGSMTTGSNRSLDTVGLRLTSSFAYMAYNRAPLAFGPELGLATSIAPGPAITTYSELQPGLAMWYAPFKAPLLLGTAVQFRVIFSKGADPVIATSYPGLRIRWGF